MPRFITIMIFALILTAQTAHAAPLKVAVPVAPQKYFAERIGGERVSVSILIAPGREPDVYDPSPREIVQIAGSDVIFTSAFAFEKRMAQNLSKTNPGIVFADLNRGIKMRVMEMGHDHETGGPDPHTWLSPANAAIQAKTIAAKLSELDPEGKAEYEKRLAALINDLEKLDREIKELLAGLEKREIFVYHPAYGYFTDAYGLIQVPVETGGREPGAKAYGNLIDRAKKAGAKAVFAGPQSTNRPAKALANELGAKLVLLDPLGADYLGNMKTMALEIKKALEGKIRP